MPDLSNSNIEGIRKLPVAEFLDLCRLIGKGLSLRSSAIVSPAMPVVDVRSPGEYSQGHIPGACNLPLFSDEERAEVGTVYKQRGHEEAVFRGLAIVGPKMEDFARKARSIAGSGLEVAMYCSRGGMRSGSLSWLFAQAGVRVHLLEGGYKAFRQYALSFLEGLGKAQPYSLLVLGGRTGSGKTDVLRRMAFLGAQVLDLEGMACHRGSAFGSVKDKDQPSCEHFSNQLALALSRFDPALPVWVEDESENIGLVNQPKAFYHLLRASALVVLDVPRHLRQKRVLEEYGDIPNHEMSQALDRIHKRLGGLAHKQAHEFLDKGDLSSLACVLLDYYDRAYDKQIRSREPVAVVHAERASTAAKRLVELEREFLPSLFSESYSQVFR